MREVVWTMVIHGLGKRQELVGYGYVILHPTCGCITNHIWIWVTFHPHRGCYICNLICDIIETRMSNNEETSQQYRPPLKLLGFVCMCVFVSFFKPCPNKQKMSNKLISVNVIW